MLKVRLCVCNMVMVMAISLHPVVKVLVFTFLPFSIVFIHTSPCKSCVLFVRILFFSGAQISKICLDAFKILNSHSCE